MANTNQKYVRDLTVFPHPFSAAYWKMAAKEVTDLRTLICRCLLELGFSTKHDGFQYLIDAVAMMTQDVTLPVTKIIYPSIARIHNCSPENVERSIRTAMEYAWDHGDRTLWCRYFPDAGQRPTNAVFISRISEALLLKE